MFNLGFGEILFILVALLLFIGPKKLPGLAKGLGKGMREFNDALRGITSPDNSNSNDNNSATQEVADKSHDKSSEDGQEVHSEEPVDHSDLEETADHDHHDHEVADVPETPKTENKDSPKKS